jgi:hypothetical protein
VSPSDLDGGGESNVFDTEGVGESSHKKSRPTKAAVLDEEKEACRRWQTVCESTCPEG